MHRRRFSVGAGHRDQLELAGRVIEELGRDIGEGCARIRYDGHPNAVVDRSLTYDRDSAARHRVGREVVTVTVKPRNRDEERPLLHPARVVRDLVDVELFGSPRTRDLPREKQRAELHARTWSRRRSAATYAGRTAEQA